MSERSIEDWLAQYELSHQHPMNRRCHSLGIPLVVTSVVASVPALFMPSIRWFVLGLFASGWVLQFVGHAYERKRPEFFNDWRFLFVGVRWWLAKLKRRRKPPPRSVT